MPHVFPWVRIVRRCRTYPVSPDDGAVVKEINSVLFETGTEAATDLDNGTISVELRQRFQEVSITLSGNALLRTEAASGLWSLTDGARRFTLALGSGGITTYTNGVFSLLDRKLKSETVYYYALFPFRGSPPEYLADKAYRTAAMATGPFGAAERLYDLLPRIYHRYDKVQSHKVPAPDREKGELRRLLDIPGGQLDQLYSFARAALDLHDPEKVDGRLLPLLAEWIGWQTDYRNELGLQRNEVENAPFVYRTTGMIPNLEAAVKRISGWECRTKEFVHNVFASNRPEKLNLWLLERNGNGDWTESTEPFSLDYAFEGRPAAARDDEGRHWLFYHTCRERPAGKGQPEGIACTIWCKRFDGSGWSPSEPLTDRLSIDKYPAAAFHDGTLWLFWSVFDPAAAAWHIEYRVRAGEGWSEVRAPGSAGYDATFGAVAAERKLPLTVSDDAGGLWLCWLERADGTWRMRYNRHDGSGWQLPSPGELPEADILMEDPFLLFHAATKRLYLFWSHRDASGRSVIACRRKNGIDPGLADWDPDYQILPADAGPACDDRCPAGLVTEGRIELFWSSNRGGSWSILHAVLDQETESWGDTDTLTSDAYTRRDPLPLAVGEGTLLIYRSNRSITYASRIYRATQTTDFRYAGSTTVDVRNSAKNQLYLQYGDFRAYTSDTGRDDDNRYARDTVGLHLKAGTGDPGLIDRNRGIISQLLAEIMPVQARSVFSIETVYQDDYDFPNPDNFTDLLTGAAAPERYPEMRESRIDTIGDWLRLYSCDPVSRTHLDGHTVNFAVPPATPVDTGYRTWHTGVNRTIEEN